MGLYVDDMLFVGDKKEIEIEINTIKKIFELRVVRDVKDFIGCEMIVQDTKVILHQSKLIVKFLDEFKSEIADMKWKETPMSAKVIRPNEDSDDLLDTSKQTRYQSGVGTLLYIIKHSRPDLSNAVRELSKAMDQADESCYKLMLSVINHLKFTQCLGVELKQSTTLVWNLNCFSDSDFAGDIENRKSISGFIIYLNDNLISWSSKQQPIVTTSSTEAEYVSLSDMVKEILFIKGIIKFMGIEVKTPIKINVDNKGAIFISENPTVKRTKHIDTRYHFIRQYVKDNIVEIEFIQSDKNKSDIMTKNFSKCQ